MIKINKKEKPHTKNYCLHCSVKKYPWSGQPCGTPLLKKKITLGLWRNKTVYCEPSDVYSGLLAISFFRGQLLGELGRRLRESQDLQDRKKDTEFWKFFTRTSPFPKGVCDFFFTEDHDSLQVQRVSFSCY